MEGRGGYGSGLGTKGNSETWTVRALMPYEGLAWGHKDLGRSQRDQKPKKTGVIWIHKQRKCHAKFQPSVVGLAFFTGVQYEVKKGKS